MKAYYMRITNINKLFVKNVALYIKGNNQRPLKHIIDK